MVQRLQYGTIASEVIVGPVTLPRRSAAIALPSMMRAVMALILNAVMRGLDPRIHVLLLDEGVDGRAKPGHDELLARRDDFLQRRDQRGRIARNGQPLDAGRGARG